MSITDQLTEQDRLREYLLLCARQLDDGEIEEMTLESLIAEGDARRALQAGLGR